MKKKLKKGEDQEKMDNFSEVNFLDVEENEDLVNLVNKVIGQAFYIEGMDNANLYINIILTNPENIRKANREYRNIDKETDVLSFPMFEKEEIKELMVKGNNIKDVLGDIIISISRVEEQAKEYEHSFEREFAYMLVHGFYHLMGYDHVEENDKKQMREKEEFVLNKVNISR